MGIVPLFGLTDKWASLQRRIYRPESRAKVNLQKKNKKKVGFDRLGLLKEPVGTEGVLGGDG